MSVFLPRKAAYVIAVPSAMAGGRVPLAVMPLSIAGIDDVS